LVELGCYAIAAGFVIAFSFLFGKMYLQKYHARSKVFWGSLIGALLIAVTMILSLVTVVGLSVLADVSLTAFSNMSFVLSVGFAVEYSVHIVQRWLCADLSHESSITRVKHTMSFLTLPTFMSFVSSTIGVVCLAFTEFEFNEVFFFRPL
jgi:predicted RND superfamily exporter protein